MLVLLSSLWWRNANGVTGTPPKVSRPPPMARIDHDHTKWIVAKLYLSSNEFFLILKVMAQAAMIVSFFCKLY